jgi:hypothetical protein
MEVAIPLQHHWAISAISEDDRNRTVELINKYFFRQKVGLYMVLTADDEELLDRLSAAYEIAALEGLDALIHSEGSDDALREQAISAAGYAFDTRCLTTPPEEAEKRIFHVLQLSALAWVGGRRLDLLGWFIGNKSAIVTPGEADSTPWDQRILYRLFKCWIWLFRENRYKTRQRRDMLIELRAEQREYEKTYLEDIPAQERRADALRLIALYNWTKATELFIEWAKSEKDLLYPFFPQEQLCTVPGDIDKHFEASIKAASASGDIQFEMTLRWIHAAILMLKTPLEKERRKYGRD